MSPATNPETGPGKAGAGGQRSQLSWRNPWIWPRFVAIGLLHAYKRYLSPLLPPSCRFTPTCAEYAIDAINKYGIFKGALLTCRRLLRCNPFCRGGYDPVP